MKTLKNTSILILLLLSACQKDCAITSDSDKTDKPDLSVVNKQKENKKQKQKTKKEVKLENSLGEENTIKPDSATTIADEPDLSSLSNNEEQAEQERVAKAEQERIAKEEQERKAKEEQERKVKEEQERIAKAAEQERVAKAEQERIAKEEQERKAKEEQERKVKEEQERIAKAEQERKAKEEQERIAKEEQERIAKKEQERIAKEEKINNIVDDLFKKALEKPLIINSGYGKTKSIDIDYLKRKLGYDLIYIKHDLSLLVDEHFIVDNVENSLKKAYKDYIDLDYYTPNLIDDIKKAKSFAENLDNKEFIDKYNESVKNLSEKEKKRKDKISTNGFLNFLDIIGQTYKNKETGQLFNLKNKNNDSIKMIQKTNSKGHILTQDYDYYFTGFLDENKTDYFDFTNNKQIKDELNDESIDVLNQYGLIKANQEVDDLLKAQSELMDTAKDKENFAEWKNHKDKDLAYYEKKLQEKEEKLQALKKVFSDIADKIKQKL